MDTIKRWVISDQYGKDIFYFELYTIDGIEGSIYFDTNLNFNVEHLKILDLLELLISVKNTADEREIYALQLFDEIKKTEFYTFFYFPYTVLNSKGKLNKVNYELLQRITLERLMCNNCDVPYSVFSFPEVFSAIENYYFVQRDSIMSASIEIIKERYETKLINTQLQQEYVNIYNDRNKYFIYSDTSDIQSCFILNEGKLVFVFESN